MRSLRGYSLAELIVIVLIIGLLASVAVPRFQFGASGRQAEVEAKKLVTGLRRTRSLAIIQAATHPAGFAFEIHHQGRNTRCEILDLDNSAVLASWTLPKGVECSGTSRLVFSGLGAMTEPAEASLTVATTDASFEITVVPCTGAVRCAKQ